MDLFQTSQQSHEHSLQTLELLAGYHDFMDGLTTICDMGFGAGHDLLWWANSSYEDDDGNLIPRNYKCVGIDTDTSKMGSMPSNVRVLKADFEDPLPMKTDLIWSHDSFRYAVNPLNTLKLWNEILNDNGMMILIVPQSVNITYNRPVVRSFSGCYHNYTITNLIYMMAVNGFDCKDGHFVKYNNDPWLHCVVYKSDIAPMDPKKTSWYDLVDAGLLPDSADASIKQYGFLKQEDLQTHWLSGHHIFWKNV